MRQIWITKFGPPEVLAVRQAPDPEPGRGEVRIRVEASGVNFADIVGRVGFYPDLPPVVPGYEVSGRIDAADADVDTSWIGRDVLAMARFGGYADVICVPVQQIFARPPGSGRRRHRVCARHSGCRLPRAPNVRAGCERSLAQRAAPN